MVQNLAAVAANYRRAGLRLFVLAYFVRSAGVVREVRKALGLPLRVARLTVPLPDIDQRLARDVTSGCRDDLRAAAASIAVGEGTGVEDVVISNDRPIGVVAGDVMTRFISLIALFSTVLIIRLMLMEAVRWLRESGLKVEDRTVAEEADAGVDAVLDVAADGQRARFAVQVKRRAPYPHEVEQLERSWRDPAGRGLPLMVAPFVSESLGSILTRAGWSWADDQGNFDLRAPGLLLRQRRTTTTPAPKRRSLPRGSGSFAVIRSLVAFSDFEGEEPGATALAAQAGVSQPRASQVLRHLHDLDLVENSGHGRWKPHREALLDRFLAEYPGPGGSEQYCYSLDSPTEVAIRAGQASAPRRPIVASADVGPDLIVPWRRPSLVILYVKGVIDPSALGLVDAQGRHDANVIVRMPDDLSVFPGHALIAQVRGNDVPLADPLQQIWDLQDLGGADRLEAAGRLRQWLLSRP
jgi:hypothetical protein